MKDFITLPVTNTPRVAFYGPMCAGKTWAADHIPNAKKFSLATPIKRIAFEYYDIKGKTNGERKLLQELGDSLKKFDPDVFTKYLLNDISDYYDEQYFLSAPYMPIVVDDVRFPDEADNLRKNGFIIVKVHTPDEIRLERVLEKYPDTANEVMSHHSEQRWQFIEPDYTISGEKGWPFKEWWDKVVNDIQE